MRKITLTDGKSIFLLAFLIQAWGIGVGLPDVIHPDEPHQLNIAARFGTGDLNPHDFKYPTLWPYVIAGLLGAYYLLGSLFHVVSSAHEFAALFLRSPSLFYVSVRLLSALSIAMGIWLLYRTGLNYYSRRFAVVLGLFGCCTPAFLEIGKETTPYAFMVLLLCAAVYFLHEMRATGSKRSYLLSGLFIGLAASTHYIAGVFGLWLLALHATRPTQQKNHVYLLYGVLMCAAGFFLGTPFALLDAHVALASLLGHTHQYAHTTDGSSLMGKRIFEIVRNIFQFLDGWGVGFFLAVVGYVSLDKEKKTTYLAWLSPFFILFFLLVFATFGALVRYVMASYLIFLFLAAGGFGALWDKTSGKQIGRVLLCGLVFLPLVTRTVQAKRKQTLPDTRTAAKKWVLQTVPMGSKIFLTDPFYCPQFDRSRPQIERLLKKTEALNHPRKEYFRILLESGANGGYEIYYLRRPLQDILEVPGRVESAYQAQDWFDLEQGGLEALRREGIRYVLVDENASVRRRDSNWLKDLNEHVPIAAEFNPAPGKMKGYPIKIFDLNPPNPTASAKPAIKA